jgi:hypothetical protein
MSFGVKLTEMVSMSTPHLVREFKSGCLDVLDPKVERFLSKTHIFGKFAGGQSADPSLGGSWNRAILSTGAEVYNFEPDAQATGSLVIGDLGIRDVVVRRRLGSPLALMTAHPVTELARVVPRSSDIPEASPLHAFLSLQRGWDGYWAEPLSKDVLWRAHQLWRQILRLQHCESDLPTVRPAANGCVAFTWSGKYPAKELEVWLYDRPDFYAEAMLTVEDSDQEQVFQSQSKLLKLIGLYCNY